MLSLALHIEGMMCGHCEARVKKVLEEIDGVEFAEVSHKDGTAIVTLSKDVNNEDMKAAVEAQDYKVIEIGKEIKEIKTMTKTMKIEGMMCPHCEKHTVDALEAIDGVEKAVASHEAKNAVVTLSKDVDNAVLKKAVEDAGYQVISID